MSTKHTPGPWSHYNAKLRPQFSVRVNEIHGPNGEVIVQWGGFDAADGKKSEIKFNARLIAAAPELLNACRAVVDSAMRNSAYDACAAAIAAATGESA